MDSVTNAAGGVEVRLSYGAFGQRRKEAGWSGAPTTPEMDEVTDTTRRGFTFHEMLDNLGLIHMNGRVYDPVVGRFLSADPFIPSPGLTQSFNRYAYVLNNPLSLTDPSGFAESTGMQIRMWIDRAAVPLHDLSGILFRSWYFGSPVPGQTNPTPPDDDEPPPPDAVDEKVDASVTSCPGDFLKCGKQDDEGPNTELGNYACAKAGICNVREAETPEAAIVQTLIVGGIAIGIMAGSKLIVGGALAVTDIKTTDSPSDPPDAPRDTDLGEAFPNRALPRDEYGNPVPEANAPHTQLGRQEGRRGSYPQAREFDANGRPVRDIDFTDHGRGHPNPHQHRYEPNPTGGTPRRGPYEPLEGT